MGFIALGIIVAMLTFLGVRWLHAANSGTKYTLRENALVASLALLNGGIWAGAIWAFVQAGL